MGARSLLAAGSLAALALAAAPATAQDGGWRFQVTPYVWASSLSGDIRPFEHAPTFHVGLSFRDIFEDLNGALFVTATARYDRFLLFGDFSWADVSRSERIPVPGFGVADATASLSQASLTLAAGYTVVQEPGFALDLLAGARGWRLRTTLDVRLGPLSERYRTTEDWVDPIVGARLRADLSDRWSIILHGDIGGFGVGSELTWQLVGTVNYRITEQAYVSAGYRHMSFDYSSNGLELDVDLSGPILGVTWRF